MNFIISLISFNIIGKVFCLNLFGNDSIGYFLQFEIVDGIVNFDFLFLKRPVLKVIAFVKSLFSK